MRREVIGDAELWLGDCRELIGELPRDAAVVSDPPYGMAWDTDSTRFSGGNAGHRKYGDGRGDWSAIIGDDCAFDPSPWLTFPQVILWGSNHFAGRLPVGTTLVWLKRLDPAFGSFLSDAEVAWMKGGHGVYCHRDLSMMAEANDRQHPSQKPVGLMSWCVAKTKAATIIDPYLGSGTTGVAAIRAGRRFVGVEIEPRYFEVALRRTEAEVNAPRLELPEPAPKPQQADIFARYLPHGEAPAADETVSEFRSHHSSHARLAVRDA